MKKQIFKPTIFTTLRSCLGQIIFSLLVVGAIVFALGQTDDSSRAEGIRTLTDSIHRAAVKAYAFEGNYPIDLAHIERHYNIYIDRSNFMVYYTAIGSNRLPNITVVELGN
ncbi:MAG: hypothetical protein LBD23_11690 [Oscillospiraceae bacterium]|jgi:hypothetical protein|nr:hypothetical protein [Oscillospiraceae bacterium]